MNIQTLKGFRDFLPAAARKRQYVINTLKSVFESYGFEPLETPTLEYEEILAGKYGQEGDKLMYKFKDLGERNVAMRYDQTVPLARVVAQYENELPMPFKRYQIQNVFRADNTQKGRFREFLQCDADIVGSSSPLSDAEVIAVAAKSLEKLGFEKFKILINDRAVFSNLLADKRQSITEKELPAVIRAIDKLKKIGKDKVMEEIIAGGIAPERAMFIYQTIEFQKPTKQIREILKLVQQYGIDALKVKFDPTLARGLDYYTGLIFEIEVEGYSVGSVAGGGRFDNLIGMFADKQIPAVGFAFGFDRLIEAMEELNLFPDLTKVSTTRVLVTIFSGELMDKSIELANYIRSNNLNCELYDNGDDKLEKQIKYADKKGIMYAAIIGPEEIEKDMVTIKNLRIRDQQTVKREDLLKVI
ncbi:MAG TPA: histidine--tRNA ligase [Candidatus Saccharimonadales bacterium]|nr:histidine--tRNA ligase [Candidatus Saccharimonadales bacterium]